MQFTTTQVLSGSVGAGGTNRRDDVALVQLLLNAERTAKKLPLLAVDGIAGPNTVNAIRGFQTAYLDFPPDGRVDPTGLTLRALAFAYFHLLSCALVGLEKLPPGIGVDESLSWHFSSETMTRAAAQFLADMKHLVAKNLGPAPQRPASPQPDEFRLRPELEEFRPRPASPNVA